MNKYLMLCAAALVTTALPAAANESAKSHSAVIYFGSSTCGNLLRWEGSVYDVQYSIC